MRERGTPEVSGAHQRGEYTVKNMADNFWNEWLNCVAKVEKQQEQNERKQSLIDYVFDFNFLPDNFSGYKKPNFDKLVEMAVFFTDKMSPTSTKMNKLLFYADFLNYKSKGYSISGTRYFAHHHGPVPQKFRTLFDYLADERLVDLISVQYPNGMVGEKFEKSLLKSFNANLFAESEIKTLEEVVSKFKTLTATEIRQISHEEKAWIDNEKEKQLIDYNYSFELIHI